MHNSEIAEETVRVNFEHWLREAIRSGQRGGHLQPLTTLTTDTWQAIDAVADAVAGNSGRLQAAVFEARRALERQFDQTHPVTHVAHTAAA